MLGHLLRLVFPYAVFAFLLGVFGWTFRRWLRSSPRISLPVWRSYSAVFAFSLATLSFLLWLVLFAWARAIGGFPYYHPVVMRFYGWGFLTGAAGLLVSLIGKGKLRWPACGLAALMAFLWLAAATSE
jgi:hypothetical protein